MDKSRVAFEVDKAMEAYRRILAKGGAENEVEDLLRQTFAVGYQKGYAAGEAACMDELCPNVGM